MFFTESNGKDVLVAVNAQMFRITACLTEKSKCQHLRYADAAAHEWTEVLKMTLDEAIRHCINEVYLNQMRGCDECASEHEQLAEWLNELKQRREAEITAPQKSNGDRIRQMTDEELADFFCQISQCCLNDAGCSMCPIYDGCAQNVMYVETWLKQEVSEDAEESL